MLRRVEVTRDLFRYAAIGLIFNSLETLILDDGSLRFEFLLREYGEQVGHSISFHPQRQLEKLARHDLVIVGPVVTRCTIDGSAGLLQWTEILAVIVRRSFKHQVFEEMGDASAFGVIVLGTDMVPEIDSDEWNGVVGLQNDPHSVVEAKLLERDYQAVKASRGWRVMEHRQPIDTSMVCGRSS